MTGGGVPGRWRLPLKPPESAAEQRDSVHLSGERHTKQQWHCIDPTRTQVTDTDFDEAAWIRRLGTALEDVAANAMPQYSPIPPMPTGIRPIGEFDSAFGTLQTAYFHRLV